jgi:hypothetical protein
MSRGFFHGKDTAKAGRNARAYKSCVSHIIHRYLLLLLEGTKILVIFSEAAAFRGLQIYLASIASVW